MDPGLSIGGGDTTRVKGVSFLGGLGAYSPINVLKFESLKSGYFQHFETNFMLI